MRLQCALFAICSLSYAKNALAHKIEDIENRPAEKECKAGFTMVGDICRRVETRTPQKSCKSHWKLVGNMCVYKFFDMIPGSCPKDGVWDGRRCVVKELVSPVETCPENYELNRSRCTKRELHSPDFKCPKGFKNSGDGTCYTETRGIAFFECPDGFIPTKHGCAKSVEESTMLVCEHGFQLQGNICIKEDHHDPELKCKPGYLLLEATGMCSRRVQKFANASCPTNSEYDPKARVCIRKIGIPPILTCPDEYVLSSRGECEKILKDDPISICNDGYIYEDGQCIALEFLDATYKCPPDQTYSDGFCVVVESQLATERCRTGFTPHGGKCRAKTTTKPKEGCPTDFILCDGICRKIVTTPKEVVCRDGELRGKKCISYKAVPADPYCKLGGLYDGSMCVFIDDICPVTSCPDGYQKFKDGTCGTLEYLEPEIECPEGSVRAGKNGCETIVAEAPELSCPKNFTLMDFSCQRIYEGTPSLTCPAGWKLKDGRCQRHPKKECNFPC